MTLGMRGGDNIMSGLGALGVSDYLQYDARPAFVIDTRSYNFNLGTASLPVHYVNQAFEQFIDPNPVLVLHGAQLLVKGSDKIVKTFFSWIRDGQSDTDFDIFGMRWTTTTLRQQWRIVSGTSMSRMISISDHAGPPNSVDVSRNYGGHMPKSRMIAAPLGTFSSTILLPRGAIPTSHHKLMQNHNWSNTSLGPIETWSAALRQTASFTLNSTQPCCLFWGSDRTIMYNEAYISLIQDFHPAAIGASARVVFASFWATFEEIFQQTEQTGRSVRRENVRVSLDRSGHLEEAFFTGTYMPILESDGIVGGTLNMPIEVTKQVVTQRQLLTLVKIGEGTALKTNLDSYWQGFFESIKDSGSDIPVAAVYSIGRKIVSTDPFNDMSSGRSVEEDLFLEGSIGFSEHHSAIPPVLRRSSQIGFAQAIRLAASQSSALHIGEGSLIFAPDLLRGCQDSSASADLSHFVIAPLQLSPERVSAWLILGVSPLRQFDSEYQRFFNLVSRQVEDAAVSVVSLERERQRLRQTVKNAEEQQRLLSEELAQQRREAHESELRFMNFAKQAPVGVYIIGPSGEVKFSNDAWCRLVGIPSVPSSVQPWRVHVHPDDLEETDKQWQLLVQGHPQTNFEWRAIVSNSQEPNGEPEIRYLRSSCFPELADDGTMKTVTGILMDVSVHKAHERATTERLENALEAKRAQENFMDMVSHEMRNPLNAILQCAEEAEHLMSLSIQQEFESPGANYTTISEAIDTILYCGRHQKQIIDDVLTISKLDSDLLTLSPCEIKPSEIVKQAFKVFASEIRAFDIQASYSLSANTHDSTVIVDPSRVLQILINLMGNAIKFLKERPTRKLVVTVTISSTRPASDKVTYVPSGRQRNKSASLTYPVEGDVAYMHFSVEDTGPGLTPEEMSNLFARFKQGSPRTHIQYGGSGLGLFISRQLAELHGGEIGLHSEVNQGSTFAFYISGQRVRQLEKRELHPTLIPPAINNDPQEDKMSDTTRNTTVGSSQNPRRFSLADITVLIVEDNLINQRVLSRQLRSKGLANITANHGEEALAVIQRSSWWHDDSNAVHLSIILCDLEMPVMDGMTCIRQIRKWQQEGLLSSRIPAVAITGNARLEQVNAAKQAGFDDVMCKPYSITDLIPLIKKLANTSG